MALMFKSQFRAGTQDDGNLSPHKVEPNFIRRFAGVFVGLFFSDWWVSRNIR
jgi:hypothetical protein